MLFRSIYKKAKKQDLPMLIEYKLLTITPYLKSNQEKLMTISTINDFVSKNYEDFEIIYYNLKPIGTYLIKNKELNTLYIKEEYQKEKIWKKIIQKIKPEIEQIKLLKQNQKGLQFFKKYDFHEIKEEKEYLILRKDDKNENE